MTKLDKKSKALLRKRIRELYANHTNEQIVEIMTKEGFSKADGSALTTSFIAAHARKAGVRKYAPPRTAGRKRRKKTGEAQSISRASGSDQRALIELVVDCNLSKTAKMRVIEALL